MVDYRDDNGDTLDDISSVLAIDLARIWAQLHTGLDEAKRDVYIDGKRVGSYETDGDKCLCTYRETSEVVPNLSLPMMFFMCERKFIAHAFSIAVVAGELQ